MFTALAENFGNMREKINLFVALCPITNLAYSTDGMMQKAATSAGYSSLANTLSTFGIHELMGPRWAYLEASLCLVFPCSLLSGFGDGKASSINDVGATTFV